MDVRQPVAAVLADILEQRSLGVAIVVGAKPGRHLNRQHREHRQHHPAAGGVVADRGVRLTPVQVGEVPQSRNRAS